MKEQAYNVDRDKDHESNLDADTAESDISIANVPLEAEPVRRKQVATIARKLSLNKADEELAQKLQAEEGGKFFEVKKARLLVEMINERKRLQKTNEEQSAEEEKELSKEELQKLMMIVPVEEVYVEALQVNHKFKRGLLGIKGFYKFLLLVQLSTSKRRLSTANLRRQEHDMEFEFDLDTAKDVSTAEEDISTAKPVSTAGAAVTTASVDVSTATVSTAKDKGKGIMEESEPVQTKTKLQQEQERLDSEIEKPIPESTTRCSKRDAEEELVQESSKRQKTGESSVSAKEPKDKEEELSQERLQQMMIIVLEQGMNVEALQTKYPIINWEIYTEGARKVIKDQQSWKIIPRLYDSCGVHHVSIEKGIDIYMLIEKEYPLSRGTLTQILVAKLLVKQDNEMSIELLMKIFMQAKRPRR
ncbi:hypothetical protein Tco_1141863 [Tanacetum coccineum]